MPNYDFYGDLAPVKPGLGGLDESWDAVDYQNMFLAMVPPDTSLGIIPSFHRPELGQLLAETVFRHRNFLPPGRCRRSVLRFKTRSALSSDHDTQQRLVDLKRRIILRPLPEDHPNFPNGDGVQGHDGAA